MLRNKCAACATSLDSQDTTSCVRYLYESSDALPGCARCQTRYCSAACRRAHWRDGHEQVCEEIARGGGAEQHYADQKYLDAIQTLIKKDIDWLGDAIDFEAAAQERKARRKAGKPSRSKASSGSPPLL